MPNHLLSATSLLNKLPFKGIILTGGKEERDRDRVENYALDFSIRHHLPLIGICHGMQVMQRYCGWSLQQVKGHVMHQQELVCATHTRIVNSYHDWGTADPHQEFKILGRSNDAVIKAIMHNRFPFMGLMWHPERLSPFHKEDIQLFKSFISVIHRL